MPLQCRAAVDQLPVIMLSLAGPEYLIGAVNDGCREFLGRSGLVGQPIRAVLPDVAGQQVFEMLDRVYLTGTPETGREWRVQLDRGQGSLEERFIDISAQRWQSADGTIGLAIAGKDVTASVQDRQAAEQQAREAQQRYLAARAVAARLQEALLPTALPILPQARIAARYLVAGQDKAAGGDWFDAIPFGDGRVVLIVGDVVGHGTAASAAMARLRAVLTELLSAGDDLATVLARVDRFAASSPALRAATLVMAALDPSTGALQYVTCGHPAPLVIGSGGARFLPQTPGGPLGTGSAQQLAADAVGPGEVLFLYSDGLIQRPERTLRNGMAELAAAADAAANRVRPGWRRPEPAERVCQLTVESLLRTGYADDATALAAERLQAPLPVLHLELTAEAASLTVIRRAIREWMASLRPLDDDQDGVHMAVVEVVTNAIEHAYPRGHPGLVQFDLALQPDGRLECVISDYGTWHAPDPAATDRGNGLMVAEHMVDQVLISHPAEADNAPPGAATTVVRILHRMHRPAVLNAGPSAQPAATPAGPVFAVQAQLKGTAARARVRGPVDITTADDFLRRLLAACRGGTLPLAVDLTGVTHLASAGVSALYRLARQLADHHHPLELTASANGHVQDVLKLTGLAYSHAPRGHRPAPDRLTGWPA